MRVRAAGIPAVFLPGWGLGKAPLARILSEDTAMSCRWQVWDLPGGADTPTHFTEARDALLARLPPVVHLGGWSLGALLALAIARHAPERVQSLALVSATPSFLQRPEWPWGISPAELRAFSRNLRRASGVPQLRNRLIAQFVSRFCAGDTKAETTSRFLLETADPPPPAALMAGLGWLAEADLRDGLARVACPVTLIHGENDPLMPLAAGAWLATHLPHARLIALPGKAHAPFCDSAPTPGCTRFLRECASP
ncbi:MAG: alpha/beta fold hydrolase [Zoogloeaceae bacterium]|jgi:pimeloyl-[acyl-carrier protein] methyl ester esterase|nr:alpha/beta fold hydrolase [Zoogloeaceae bacterium]